MEAERKARLKHAREQCRRRKAKVAREQRQTRRQVRREQDCRRRSEETQEQREASLQTRRNKAVAGGQRKHNNSERQYSGHVTAHSGQDLHTRNAYGRAQTPPSHLAMPRRSMPQDSSGSPPTMMIICLVLLTFSDDISLC